MMIRNDDDAALLWWFPAMIMECQWMILAIGFYVFYFFFFGILLLLLVLVVMLMLMLFVVAYIIFPRFSISHWDKVRGQQERYRENARFRKKKHKFLTLRTASTTAQKCVIQFDDVNRLHITNAYNFFRFDIIIQCSQTYKNMRRLLQQQQHQPLITTNIAFIYFESS